MRIPSNNLVGPELVEVGPPLVVTIGIPFAATLSSERTEDVGARVEYQPTGAIISAYRRALLVDGLWTVMLDAPTTEGLFQLHWMDSKAMTEWEVWIPLEAVRPTLTPPSGYPVIDATQVEPSVDAVAALDKVRVVDESGDEVETFADDTRPTAEEVEGLITQALEQVLGQLPERFDPRHYPRVKLAIAFLTVVLIEASYFKAQQLKETAAGVEETAQLYERLYNETVTALRTQIRIDVEQAPRTGQVLF